MHEGTVCENADGLGMIDGLATRCGRVSPFIDSGTGHCRFRPTTCGRPSSGTWTYTLTGGLIFPSCRT